MAEAFFRRALEKGAENDQWAYNLAEICFFRGATDEAIGYYKEASRLAPGWSDPEYKLGLAFLKKGDGLRAKDHFEKFLRLEPKTARSALAKKELADLIKKLRMNTTHMRANQNGKENTDFGSAYMRNGTFLPIWQCR
jgi:tetratricopeptide (TPR) repeat protein